MGENIYDLCESLFCLEGKSKSFLSPLNQALSKENSQHPVRLSYKGPEMSFAVHT